MRILSALKLIESLGETVRERIHNKLGYHDLQAWENDVFVGLQAYRALGMQGVDSDLDTAYNVTLAYMVDGILTEMKEGETIN